MPLILRAVALNEQPITEPFAATFGAEGGSIGRSDANTLALPDPERRISRRQAEVVPVGAGWAIRNVGSANPIIVGERSLGQGETAPLAAEVRVRIGGYLLEVEEATSPGKARPPAEGPTVAPPVARDPFADLLGTPAPSPFGAPLAGASAATPLSSDNPFADLFGAPAPAPFDTGQAPVRAAPPRLPDDFDPFAPPPASPAPAPRPFAAAPVDAADPFAGLIPAPAPASIDALFGLGAPSSGARAGEDPLAAFMANVSVRGPGADGPGAGTLPGAPATDPLALFGLAGDVRPAPPPLAPLDRTPELRGAFVPPRPMPQGAPPRAATAPARPSPVLHAPVPPPPPPAAAADVDLAIPTVPPPVVAAPAAAPAADIPAGWTPDALVAWNALCEGAGVRLAPPPGSNPAFLRVVGMMLRAAVEGTVQMVAVRAATKAELQAQVTVIKPRNNNPLKFSPDAQSALEQLLQPAVRGFLPGPAAMTDAMNDLVGHAIGTMAGTRAALEGVLTRFAPQQLEGKLSEKSMLDSLLPMNRKAKLWELYLQHWDAIRDEAQEDFHALFGRAFLAAYEQQLERLKREKSGGGG